MDKPIDTSSMDNHNSGSDTDLVNPRDLPSHGEEIQEQAMQGEESDEENKDEKDCITLLPFELMSKTFAQLPHEDRLTTTSLVCKKFMDVNRTHIYKFVHIDLGKPRGADGDDDKPCLGEFTQFFTTLLTQDQLRGRVVSLAFKVHHHDLYLQLQGHLENLLKHLHSLRELSLNPPPPRYDLSSNPTTAFLRLDFRYDTTAFWHGWPASPAVLPALELSQFFHVDHVRKLQIEHVSFAPELHREPLSPRHNGTSLVDDLRFTDCSPQTVGKLPQLLRLPRALKTFALETRCPWSVALTPNARPHEMDAGQLYRALEPHSSSLQQLAVAFGDGARFLDTDTVSFKGWGNLTRLAVPEAFLRAGATTLHELLPYRLRELQLQYLLGKRLDPRRQGWGDRRCIVRLEQLAADKGYFLPELRRVDVWLQGRAQVEGKTAAGEKGLETLEVLRGLFGSVGTEFEWWFGEGFAGTRAGRELGVREAGGKGKGKEVEAFTLDEEGRSGVGLYYDGETHSVF